MSNQDTTQAKYRKASKNTSEQPQIEENEVRIKGNQGNVKRYVDYACGLLQNDELKRIGNEDQQNKDENNDATENNNVNEDNNIAEAVINDNDEDNDNKDDQKKNNDNIEDKKKRLPNNLKQLY